MKILKIYAKNVNALKGETIIDFEKFLGEDALFAITGETGSGKTTILDIIVCALYGRTPRLSNPKEMMSRGTGEMVCEAVFETKGKRYRSSWSIHRARKHPDGNFQNPKMEVADLESGKIIESKVSEVPKKVEEITGLDYDRFTRSMMLAQGSFDAFLKAKERERSALLEKMTDTKIYSEISKRVYELHSQKMQDIEKESRAIEEIKILSDEERKQLEEKQLEKNRDYETIHKDIKRLDDELNWLKEKERLKSALVEAKKRLDRAEAKKAEAQDDFVKLDRAKRAEQIKTQEAIYLSKRNNLTDIKKRLSEIESQYRIDTQKEKNLKERYQKSQKEYEAQKESLSRNQILIKKAKELQNKIDNRQNSLKELQDSISKALQKRDTLTNDIEKSTNEIESLNETLDIYRRYITENSSYKELPEVITKLTNYIAQKEDIGAKLQEDREKLTKNTNSIKSLTTDIENLKAKLSPLENKEQEIEAQYRQNSQKLSKLEESEQSIRDEYKALELSIEKIKELSKLSKELLDEQSNLTQIEKKLSHQESLEKQIKDNIKLLEEHLEDLTRLYEQEQLIKKYEDDRKRLKEGSPCPLCGALHHPYAEDEPDIEDDTQNKIEKTKKALSEKRDEYNKISILIASIKSKKEHLIDKIKDTESKISQIEDFLNEHNIKSDTDISTLSNRLSKLKDDIEHLESIRRLNRTLIESKDSINKELDSYRSKLQELQSTLDKVKIDKEHTQKAISEKEKILKEIDINIDSISKLYNLKESQSDILETLLSKKAEYEKAIKIISDSESKLASIEAKREQLQKQLKDINETLEQLSTKRADIENELKALQKKRKDILPVYDIDRFEEEINNNYNRVEREFREVETNLNKITASNEKLKSQIDSTAKDIYTLEEELKESLELLKKEIRKRGFDDIKSYQNALLDEETLQELDKRCLDIEKELQSAKTLYENLQERFKTHTKETLTQKEIDDLQKDIDEYKLHLEEILKSLGAIKQELEDDDKNRKRYDENRKRIEKLREEFEILSKLNDMIGSKDGAKFAKFAQGITLDRLIELANRHLQILSDRYLLSRSEDEKSILDFEIIDRYQADEKRPVETLSGGESFLVSLSLALGLSELASQRISIDSLFLDEGFGTLDSETLETALDALNRLQSRGKTVGVISHVNALKEAIPKQIRVRKLGGGVSRVEI